MSAIYRIKCNECGEVAPDFSTTGVRMARSYSRARGWTTNNHGVDRCSACSKKRADADAAERKANDSFGYY